jgi:hypothetical protein
MSTWPVPRGVGLVRRVCKSLGVVHLVTAPLSVTERGRSAESDSATDFGCRGSLSLTVLEGEWTDFGCTAHAFCIVSASRILVVWWRAERAVTRRLKPGLIARCRENAGSVPVQWGCAPGLTFPRMAAAPRMRSRGEQLHAVWHTRLRKVALIHTVERANGVSVSPLCHSPFWGRGETATLTERPTRCGSAVR